MQRRSWVAVLLIALLLAGCAQGTTDKSGALTAPYPSENNDIRPEHGGGDGGGGGGGGM